MLDRRDDFEKGLWGANIQCTRWVYQRVERKMKAYSPEGIRFVDYKPVWL